MGHSKPFRPGWPLLLLLFIYLFFPLKYVMDDHKKWLPPILRFFWNLHYKFFDKKNNFKINFIMSRGLFWVAQPKRKKNWIIFLSTSLKWQNTLCANLFQFFPFFSNLSKIFFLLKFIFSKSSFLTIISHDYFQFNCSSIDLI